MSNSATAAATTETPATPEFQEFAQVELTAEQIKLFDEKFRPRWHDINTNIAPSDFEQAAKALEEVFALVKVPTPPLVICSSPLAVGLSRGFFRLALTHLHDLAEKFSDTTEGKSLAATVAELQTDQNETLGIALSKEAFECWVLPINTTGIGARFAELNGDAAHREYGAIPDFWNRVLGEIAQAKSSDTKEILPTFPRLLDLKNTPNKEDTSVYKIAKESIQSTVNSLKFILGESAVHCLSSLVGKDWQEKVETFLQKSLDDCEPEVLAPVLSSIANTATEMMYGQHDWWMSQFDYFYELCPEFQTKLPAARKILNVVNHTSWYLAYRKVCWVCDRPYAFRMDGDRRLHSGEGPALGYRDGFKIYVHHGVHVPAKAIENPQDLTVEEIDSQVNVEVRRVLIEQKTWPVYLQESGAKVLEERHNDAENTNEALMEFKHGRVIMFACPSTARVYAQEVPETTGSCEEAQSYLSSGLNKRIISAA